MGRSRGGLTTKIHVLVDERGLPLKVTLTAGQTHDMQAAPRLIADLPKGSMLLADKGYDADSVRQIARDRGAWANIRPKPIAKTRSSSARSSTGPATASNSLSATTSKSRSTPSTS